MVIFLFTKTSVIKEFKQKAIDLKLPILERKWDPFKCTSHLVQNYHDMTSNCNR